MQNNGGEDKGKSRLRLKILAYLGQLNMVALLALRIWCRIELARAADTPEGFTQFYQILWGRGLPEHAMGEWVPAIYKAREENKGLIIEAFRGSSKTTSLTISWLLYQIGMHPTQSHLLIMNSDEAARKTCSQIADLIEHSPGWRLVFPQVVPDKALGWGLQGYEVKCTDQPYPLWRKLALGDKAKDPSLLGLGYRSGAVIGKHPTGVLILDDIHDEQNSSSERELATVKKVVRGTILPTMTPSTMMLVIGTPWVENDLLGALKATGQYHTVKTPILRKNEGLTSLTWPAQFDEQSIEKQRQLSGEREFARMYLLDLKAASGVTLSAEWLMRFPVEKIDPQWPVVMGLDYASSRPDQGSQRDYFALAVGRALPGGAGIVLVDGLRGHFSQGEAEEQVAQMANYYPGTQIIGVEAVGKGEEFYNLLLRRTRLPIRPVQPGRQSKSLRFERGLAPLFQYGRAWLSDMDKPFIQAFEEEWLQWPRGAHDDCLDAVYWMLYVGLPHLMGPGRKKQTTNKTNPFVGI